MLLPATEKNKELDSFADWSYIQTSSEAACLPDESSVDTPLYKNKNKNKGSVRSPVPSPRIQEHVTRRMSKAQKLQGFQGIPPLQVRTLPPQEL